MWLVAPWLGIEMPFVLALLRRHDVLDRLGVGLLDPAKQEAGVSNSISVARCWSWRAASNDLMAYMMTILLIGVVTNSLGQRR